MRICECSRPALHNQVPHPPHPLLCHGEAGPFDAKRLAAVRQAPWYGVGRPLARHEQSGRTCSIVYQGSLSASARYARGLC